MNDQAQTYSNIEIVNLVALALSYGSPDAVKGKSGDSIIVRSWKALEDSFENGRKHGFEQGYNAAKAEQIEALDAAEAAAHHVIEGICRTVWKPVS